MDLIYKEIQSTIQDCELKKQGLKREADIIHEERRAYRQIKELMGVIYDNTVRQDS